MVTTVSKRGSRAIAIVDACDDPNAATDLATYAAEFGLPKPTKANFEVVYATSGGTQASMPRVRSIDPRGADAGVCGSRREQRFLRHHQWELWTLCRLLGAEVMGFPHGRGFSERTRWEVAARFINGLVRIRVGLAADPCQTHKS